MHIYIYIAHEHIYKYIHKYIYIQYTDIYIRTHRRVQQRTPAAVSGLSSSGLNAHTSS